MTFRELEAIDHGHIHYNLRGKLWEHILKRSEVCFTQNAAAREQICTKEALDAYAEAMREQFIKRLGGIPYDSALPLQAEITGVLNEPVCLKPICAALNAVRLISRLDTCHCSAMLWMCHSRSFSLKLQTQMKLQLPSPNCLPSKRNCC